MHNPSPLCVTAHFTRPRSPTSVTGLEIEMGQVTEINSASPIHNYHYHQQATTATTTTTAATATSAFAAASVTATTQIVRYCYYFDYDYSKGVQFTEKDDSKREEARNSTRAQLPGGGGDGGAHETRVELIGVV